MVQGVENGRWGNKKSQGAGKPMWPSVGLNAPPEYYGAETGSSAVSLSKIMKIFEGERGRVSYHPHWALTWDVERESAAK